MARKKRSKGLGVSGLNAPGIMHAPGSPGQDGFNLTSHTTTYDGAPCSYPRVGRDDANAVDSRGGGGSPRVEPTNPGKGE